MRPAPLRFRCGSASRRHAREEEQRALHRGGPLLLGGVVGPGQRRPAGVVDQDVEPPEPRPRRRRSGPGWSRAGPDRRRRPAPRGRSRRGSPSRPSPDRPASGCRWPRCAPSCASTSAQARPRPLLAPPTIATLPVSSRSMGGSYREQTPALSTRCILPGTSRRRRSWAIDSSMRRAGSGRGGRRWRSRWRERDRLFTRAGVPPDVRGRHPQTVRSRRADPRRDRRDVAHRPASHRVRQQPDGSAGHAAGRSRPSSRSRTRWLSPMTPSPSPISRSSGAAAPCPTRTPKPPVRMSCC